MSWRLQWGKLLISSTTFFEQNTTFMTTAQYPEEKDSLHRKLHLRLSQSQLYRIQAQIKEIHTEVYFGLY